MQTSSNKHLFSSSFCPTSSPRTFETWNGARGIVPSEFEFIPLLHNFRIFAAVLNDMNFIIDTWVFHIDIESFRKYLIALQRN
jgi:hypothetical protein